MGLSCRDGSSIFLFLFSLSPACDVPLWACLSLDLSFSSSRAMIQADARLVGQGGEREGRERRGYLDMCVGAFPNAQSTCDRFSSSIKPIHSSEYHALAVYAHTKKRILSLYATFATRQWLFFSLLIIMHVYTMSHTHTPPPISMIDVFTC
jgi:hypothetical protein